ncbi:MAG: DUF4124 domain-containing protein [Alcanivoracaceae bacterium]|nr:DUF4124 domain-containing protein [Alcanivoracaceae bacterium]
MLRLAILLALLLPALLSAQELYRWTDEQGRTHFGDRPPQDQAPEQFQLKTQPLLGQDDEVRQRYERLERLRSGEQQKQQEEEQIRQAEAQQRRQKMAPLCAQAKRDLKALSGRVVYIDENGEGRDVSLEQVAADQKKLSQWIAENCTE